MTTPLLFFTFLTGFPMKASNSSQVLRISGYMHPNSLYARFAIDWLSSTPANFRLFWHPEITTSSAFSRLAEFSTRREFALMLANPLLTITFSYTSSTSGLNVSHLVQQTFTTAHEISHGTNVAMAPVILL